MKKSITKKYNNLRYRKEDILRITQFVFDMYEEFESAHKIFSIKLYCEDSETLEIKNESLESNKDILEVKKVVKMTIDYIDFSNNKQIKIEIAEGDGDWWNNKIEIEANDKDWVDSKMAGLSDIYQSIEPQNTLYKKYKKILFHYLSITIGYLSLNAFINLLDKLGYFSVSIENQIEKNPFLYILGKLIDISPLFKYLILFGIYWLFGVLIVLWFWRGLDKYLEKIWPSVEFVFGPEHKQYPQKQRKAWAAIVLSIIVPIMIGIILK